MPELMAPSRKLTVTYVASRPGSATGSPRLVSRNWLYPTQISTATTSERAVIVLYWRARNASAPSWIALEITCISFVPRSRASTQRASPTAKRRAATLEPSTRKSRVDCVEFMTTRVEWVGGTAARRRARQALGGRSGRARPARGAAPGEVHGHPEQHEHEARDRL